MKSFRELNNRQKHRAFKLLLSPVSAKFVLRDMLNSRGDRPLQLSFEDQFKALIFYHLQEFASGRELMRHAVSLADQLGVSSVIDEINNRPDAMDEAIHRDGEWLLS